MLMIYDWLCLIVLDDDCEVSWFVDVLLIRNDPLVSAGGSAVCFLSLYLYLYLRHVLRDAQLHNQPAWMAVLDLCHLLSKHWNPNIDR